MSFKLAITAALMSILLILPSGASAQFYGPGRWCAVVNTGVGNVTWDCSYPSIEACRPNVIAGNRGFCNLNPSFATEGPVYGSVCRIIVQRGWRHGHAVSIRRRVCS